jgi:uncharacterized membrane protein YjfL (UPF0719 family)
MENLIELKYIASALVFSAIGLVVLMVAMFVFDKLTPGQLWNEIVQKQNLALAITAAAVILAFAEIIASAIHG